MKYAFMSFSCPEADLAAMLALARKYGYDGIEPRTGGMHRHGVEIETGADDRQRILGLAADSGVAFACIAVGSRFSDPGTHPANRAEAAAGIRLAHDLECPVVRVFGGKLPAGDKREEAIARVADALGSLAPLAEDHGVTVCLETHDDWCDPRHVAAVMEAVDHRAIGVNWDIMHPVRHGLATMEESFQILRPWIRHVHVHDGTNDPGALGFRAFGEGDYDLEMAFRSLTADDYRGYLSGEWINWEPPDIHLPREIDAMRAFEAKLGRAER